MKKRTLILPILAAMTLAACGNKQQAAAPSVLDDGVLTVGLLDTGDRSCYSAKAEDGTAIYKGWEPDVFKLLDHFNEDVTVEYTMAQDREELLNLLDNGSIDVAAGAFTRLEAYDTQYAMSDDYGYGSIYLINSRNGYLDTLAAFEDGIIGVSALLPASDTASITGIDKVVQNAYSDMSLMASDISNEVINAGLCTESEMVEIMNSSDLRAAELRTTPQTALVFLMPKGQDYLQRWVNWAIDRHFYDMETGTDSTAEAASQGGN